ncbi:MAG: hypothetical protein V4510_06470 [bacterium]
MKQRVASQRTLAMYGPFALFFAAVALMALQDVGGEAYLACRQDGNWRCDAAYAGPSMKWAFWTGLGVAATATAWGIRTWRRIPNRPPISAPVRTPAVVTTLWLVAALVWVGGACIAAGLFLPPDSGTLCGGPPGLPTACIPYHHASAIAIGLRASGFILVGGALASQGRLFGKPAGPAEGAGATA